MKPFNKNKALKRIRNRRIKEQKIQFLTLGFSCVTMIIGIMFFAFAKFESKFDYTLINGRVSDFQSGDYFIGAYIDGEKSRTIPAKNSGYYLQKVECDNEAVGTWDSISWELTVSNASSQTKCYVYFTTSLALSDSSGNYSTTLKNYPIGSIYISENNTDPSTLFGGTWVSYGTGRTLVGVDTSQTEFNTVNKTGGGKTTSYTPAGTVGSHTLTIAEMPSHSHGEQIETGNGGITALVTKKTDGPTTSDTRATQESWKAGNVINTQATGGGQGHKHGFTGTAANISTLQPYITVYMWKRTA